MNKFFLVFAFLALTACSDIYEYETGVIQEATVFEAGERSICVVRFHVEGDDTLYVSRAIPIDGDLRFAKCQTLREGDRVLVRASSTDTEIDWTRL